MPEADFGQESSKEIFSPKTLTMEQAISVQMDRIAYLRSSGLEWAEAVYQLRDMVVGLEDDQFWDGMPEAIRKKVKELEHPSKDEVKNLSKEDLYKMKKRAKSFREEWSKHGWEGYPIRAYPGPDGEPIYMPTNENLSTALRIIMQLLSRQGIIWRTKRVSYLSEWKSEHVGGDD